MDETVKRKLYIGGAITIGIIVIVLIVYFSVKKSSSNVPENQPTVMDTNINVKIALQNGNTSLSKTLSVKKSKIVDYTISFFVEAMIRQTQIIDFSQISFVSLTINNKPVTINNGNVSSTQKIYPFIENDNISIRSTYVIKCDKNNMIECDICKSLSPVCGNNGWECGKASTCPTHTEMKKCCTNSNIPFASCENGIVSCGKCPTENNMTTSGASVGSDLPMQDGKVFDCGKIGCTMIGPVCGHDGWSCEANTTCPTGDELQVCASGTNMIASCIKDSSGKTRIVSSTCAEPTPQEIASCPESCDKQGLVCESVNGKNSWVCKKGVHCPSETVKNSCCTDPNKPIGVCSDSSTNVTCQGCSSNPPPCEENCFGQGLVCTVNGWKCENGVKCPSDMTKCCDSNTLPFCDTKENCVKCACETGLQACSEPVCGGIQSSEWKSPVCCGNDPPCNKPVGANEFMCCDESRACYNSNTKSYICCPTGTECKNGECVVMCGKNSDGSDNLCDSGNSCLISENLSENDIALMKKQLGSENVHLDLVSGNVYTCVPENNSCSFDNLPITFPNKNGEFYPCYSFPMNENVKCDSTSPFSEYCSKFSAQFCNEGGPECVVSNDGKSCVAKPCNNILSDNSAGYCITKNENTFDRNQLVSENASCENATNALDCEVPYKLFPNMQAWNITGTNHSTASEAMNACDNNPSCHSVTTCMLGGGAVSPFEERMGTPVSDQGSLCTSYSRVPSPSCKWQNGKCIANKCENITNDSVCGSDSNCEWRNVLSFLPSGNGASSNIDQLKKELTYITGNEFGNYCSNDDSSYSRLVALQATGNCSSIDCWKHVGGNNVIDILFDKATNSNGGTCVFTESCENSNSNSVTRVINSDGTTDNSARYSAPETVFGVCSSTNFPSGVDPNYHAGANGRIEPILWGCSSVSKRCEITNDGSGTDFETCVSNCCPTPLTKGSDGKCYYSPFTSKPNDGIAAFNSMAGSDNISGTQILNIPFGVSWCNGYDDEEVRGQYEEGNWSVCQNSGGCSETITWRGLNNPSGCLIPN